MNPVNTLFPILGIQIADHLHASSTPAPYQYPSHTWKCQVAIAHFQLNLVSKQYSFALESLGAVEKLERKTIFLFAFRPLKIFLIIF